MYSNLTTKHWSGKGLRFCIQKNMIQPSVLLSVRLAKECYAFPTIDAMVSWYSLT